MRVLVNEKHIHTYIHTCIHACINVLKVRETLHDYTYIHIYWCQKRLTYQPVKLLQLLYTCIYTYYCQPDPSLRRLLVNANLIGCAVARA